MNKKPPDPIVEGLDTSDAQQVIPISGEDEDAPDVGGRGTSGKWLAAPLAEPSEECETRGVVVVRSSYESHAALAACRMIFVDLDHFETLDEAVSWIDQCQREFLTSGDVILPTFLVISSLKQPSARELKLLGRMGVGYRRVLPLPPEDLMNWLSQEYPPPHDQTLSPLVSARLKLVPGDSWSRSQREQAASHGRAVQARNHPISEPS